METARYTYDEIADTIFRPIYPRIAEDILSATGVTGGRMVDVGCGGGHLGLALMERAPFTGTFLDVREEALALARRRAEERGLLPRCSFLAGDVHQIALPDGCADLVISRGSIIFWSDQERAFREIYRILAPGGRTYVGTGLGSTELREQIRARMKAADPGWPRRQRENSKALSTPAYRALFAQLGWDFEILENEEQGRWIILRKGAGPS